jgi:flavin reductase (DIM6/NTAB) family NADH-FMN oxidoreductase RutF
MQSTEPHILASRARDAIAQVYALLDPPLWLVTAAHDQRQGGLIATFVARASIVSGLPRMLIGIAKQHHTWRLIEGSGRFALHLLHPEQSGLVWRFGTQSGKDTDKFEDLPTRHTPGGSPLIPGTLAWLDCRVEERMDAGDRTVYLAAVESGAIDNRGQPLTAGQLYVNAPDEQRRSLDALYARDARIDTEAILAWRAARASA